MPTRCVADPLGDRAPPHNVALTGPRGTGKTVLLNWFKRACRDREPGLDANADSGQVQTALTALQRLGFVWRPPGQLPPVRYEPGIPSLMAYILDHAAPTHVQALPESGELRSRLAQRAEHTGGEQVALGQVGMTGTDTRSLLSGAQDQVPALQAREHLVDPGVHAAARRRHHRGVSWTRRPRNWRRCAGMPWHWRGPVHWIAWIPRMTTLTTRHHPSPPPP